MKIRESIILELLRAKPGRYILHDMGDYTMKEADGTDVLVDGELVKPWHNHMDALEGAGKLICDGSKYRLA